MAPSDELEYLKSLVTQLNDKIQALEQKTEAAVTPAKTPAQTLRTILIGPPGAGGYSDTIFGVQELNRSRKGYTGT